MRPEDHTKKDIIHHIAFYSPLIYLIALVVGFTLDMIFPLRVIPENVFLPLGIIFIVLAPLLILWAQYSTYSLYRRMAHEVKTEHFHRGPYRFSRHPSHLGLAFLILGLGLLFNSLFIIAAAVISHIIVNYIFLPLEERILERKYGKEYLEYKRRIRRWI